MAQERDDLVYLAKLAEQAERFDEMVSAGAGLIFDAPRPKRGRGPRRETSQRPRASAPAEIARGERRGPT